MPKTCHVAVSKPNRNSLWGLGRYHGKASGTPSQAAAEGFAVQRPSKAAAGLWKLLRERATWQFRSPIETACGASGGTMAKQAGRLRKLLRRVLRLKGLRKLLRGF